MYLIRKIALRRIGSYFENLFLFCLFCGFFFKYLIVFRQWNFKFAYFVSSEDHFRMIFFFFKFNNLTSCGYQYNNIVENRYYIGKLFVFFLSFESLLLLFGGLINL